MLNYTPYNWLFCIPKRTRIRNCNKLGFSNNFTKDYKYEISKMWKFKALEAVLRIRIRKELKFFGRIRIRAEVNFPDPEPK